MDMITEFLFFLPGIIIGFIFHEFAHAFVADRLGDPTPRSEGKLSLSPRTHIDPLGLILIALIHIGWAKPVKINKSYLKNPKRDDILISLAGPVTNLIIAIIVLFAREIFTIIADGTTSDFILNNNQFIKNLFTYTALINVMLFVINMIPIPPLDGFHVLANITPPSFNRQLAFLENYGLYILLALIFIPSLLFNTNIFSYLYLKVYEIINSGMSTIISIFTQI